MYYTALFRQGSRKLCSLAPEERADIIRHLANSLLNNRSDIMAANHQAWKLLHETSFLKIQ